MKIKKNYLKFKIINDQMYLVGWSVVKHDLLVDKYYTQKTNVL